MALVKFEIGFQPASDKKAVSLDLNMLLDHLSSLEVAIVRHAGLRTGAQKFERSRLALAGPAISRFFAEATTGKGSLCTIDSVQMFVRPGRPLVYVEFDHDESLSYESGFRLIPQMSDDYFMFHGRRRIFNRLDVPVWVMKSGPKFTSRDKNNLRIFLLRLHAEHECLRGTLRAIARGEIEPSSNSLESNVLQRYLNEATRRVLHLGRKFRLEDDATRALALDRAEDIELLAQASFEHLQPGQRTALLERMKVIAVRKNIKVKLDSYLEADVRTAETLNLNIGKFVMNDQRQQISHSSNVVATQAGRDAKLRIDRSFSNAQGSSVRKEMLAQLFELKRLMEQAIDAGQVPEPMALARDFDDFAREASSDGPRRSKLEATAEFIEKGLARAGSIAESAAKTVKAVLDLAGYM